VPEPTELYKHEIDVPVFHEAVAHALPPIAIVGELSRFSKLKPESVRDADDESGAFGLLRWLDTGASNVNDASNVPTIAETVVSNPTRVPVPRVEEQ